MSVLAGAGTVHSMLSYELSERVVMIQQLNGAAYTQLSNPVDEAARHPSAHWEERECKRHVSVTLCVDKHIGTHQLLSLIHI